jgi:UPF0755 protein
MSNRYPGEIRDPETGKLDLKEVWYKVRSAFAVLLALSVFVGGGWFVYSKAHDAWMAYRTADDYIGEGGAPVEVTIPKGKAIADIGKILVDDGVIKTVKAFTSAAAANGNPNIAYGRYTLKLQIPAKVALSMLLDPKNQIHNRMTLKDGQRLSQAVTAMSKASGVPVKDFNAALKDWKKLGLPNWAKRGAEGFIFPDTYELPDKPTAASVISLTTTQFNSVADSLAIQDGAAAMKLTPYQIVVMASIIEREAGTNDEDRAKIARVFYNRLNPTLWPTGKLQSDATVAYANNITGRVATTAKERALKSPYNTYYVKGLPVGPISSPSKKSMEAALHPADGNWLYFMVVNLDTGETVFSADQTGQAQAFQQYQQWCMASQANRDKCNGK